jgi:hypothetical protein
MYLARWEDRRRLGLRPVQAHGEIDRPVRCRQPIRFLVGSGRILLDVNRQRAIRVLFQAGGAFSTAGTESTMGSARRSSQAKE